TLNGPSTAGTPLTSPVSASIPRPSGSPDAANTIGPTPSADTENEYVSLTTPPGNMPEVIDGAAGRIVNSRSRVSDPPAFVAVTVTVNGPCSVGVPLITPDGSIARPSGRPSASNVTAPSPSAAIVASYATPTW